MVQGHCCPHCCPTKMWLYSWFGTDFLLIGNLRKPPFARSSEPWRTITQFFTHWQKFFRDMKLIVLTENTVRETSDASRKELAQLCKRRYGQKVPCITSNRYRATPVSLHKSYSLDLAHCCLLTGILYP